VQTCKPAWIKDNLRKIDRAGLVRSHGLFCGTYPTAAGVCTFARSIEGGQRGAVPCSPAVDTASPRSGPHQHQEAA
jgi:hypothetical protein